MDDNTPKKKNKFSLLTVMIGLAGIIWLCVILAFLNKIPDIKKLTLEEVQKVITQDTTKVADWESVKGKPMPGVNVNAVGFPNPELLAKGEALYKNTCASCHGDKGKGDGAGGASLTPKPRNFTSPDAWKNGRNISSMFKTLVEGIPGSGMIAYEFLPIEDRFGVIHYIRQMVGSYPEITALELKQIDDIYDLGSARRSASQIPLKLARTKQADDNKDLTSNADKIANTINGQQGTSASLFISVTDSKIKAVTTLLKDQAWRNSPTVFIQMITDNVGRNGFKPKVAKLNKSEIESLYSYLKTII